MKISLVLFLPAAVLSLTKNDLDFGINYFKYRDVKFVCLLTCEERKMWTNQFAKQSSRYSIGVSKVSLDSFQPNKIQSCATKRTIVGILMDANCPVYEDLIYYASKNFLFDSTRKWLIIDASSNTTNFENLTISPQVTDNIKKLNISVDADVVVSIETENGHQLFEIYNYGKIQGGELIINYLGVSSDVEGFGVDLNSYKYYKRWDFQQLAMRMIVVMTGSKVFEPRYFADRLPVPGLATIMKSSGMVLNEVAESHNFKFVYTVGDRWVGDFNRSEGDTVSATSIYYGLQDIISILRFNPDIFPRIAMLHPPLTSIETRYYYRIPTFGPGKFENQFLRPLSDGAWLSVMFIASLCGCLLLLAAKWERRPSPGQYAFFSVLASICQQSRKLTIIVTGLTCVLLYNYYTSSVVSWLLNGPPPSINSLQELLDSPLELIFEDIGYARSWLKTPNYFFNKRNAKIEEQLRQKKVLNRNKNAVLTNLDQGIAMVKAGGYAFHTEVDSANRLISQTFNQEELCELGSVQSMESSDLYPAVQKNSPYKEFFNWSLMRLLEQGIVTCVQHRTRSAQVKCEGSSPRALALGGAAPAFMLLAAGYVLAFTIMMMERVAEKKNNAVLRKMLQ